jgi:DNA-binding response OmpR family regulator
MRVLIVEDDASIAANLYDYLEARGHVVDAAGDGVTGLHLATTRDFDAILLDVTLPGLDGLTLCRKLREEAGKDTPVLMLTARDTLDDKLDGFANGADDYLVKPFSLREVEARLGSLHRRHAGALLPRPLQVGKLRLDPRSATLTCEGRPVRLPPKCLRLIETMMRDPLRVFSHADLEAAVWGGEPITSDALRSQMYLLRQAIAAAGGGDPIQNLHGLGYRLVVEAPSASNP